MGRKTRKAGDPRKVVAYIRVSTDRQEIGPDVQKKMIAEWCKREGAQLVAVHEDKGVSGGAALDKRPGLLAALAELKEKEAGVLAVAKRDRLARDTMLAAMIERLAERNGARVFSADGVGNGTGPEAQLLRGIMDLFAQYEVQVIRARTRAALAAKKQRGERISRRLPFGWKLNSDGVHLEPDDDEQRTIMVVCDLRDKRLSLRKIGDRLTAMGIPTRSGRKWNAKAVSTVLNARLSELLDEGQEAMDAAA